MAGSSRAPLSVEVGTTRRSLTGRQKLTALLLTIGIVAIPLIGATLFLTSRDGGPPPTPDLISEDDDGRSPSDNRTSVTTPTFELGGLRAGTVVTITASRENDADRICVITVAEDGSGTRCMLGADAAGPLGLGPWTVVARYGEPGASEEASPPLSLEIVSAIAADCPTGADLANPTNASEIGDACAFVSGRLISVRGESRKALVGVPIIATATRAADFSEITTPLRAVAFACGLYAGRPGAASGPADVGETIEAADACGTVSDGAFWSFAVGPVGAGVAGLNAIVDATPLDFRTLDGSVATASVVMEEGKRLEFEIRVAPLPGDRAPSVLTDLPVPLAIGGALTEPLPPAERDPFAEALAAAAALYRDPARLAAAVETAAAASSPLWVYLFGLGGLVGALRLYRWARRIRPHELSLRPLTPTETASRAREMEGSSTRPRA
jgi:hypothetical protein